MTWTSHKSGLLLPSREIQRAYSDTDYERWINKRRAPFQVPFVVPLLGASIVGSPFHQYPATSGTGYNTSISCSVNDVILVSVTDTTNLSSQTGTVTGPTCTLTNRLLAHSSNTLYTTSSILSGLVTGAGMATIAVTSTGGSLSWTAVVVSGLSSAVPDKTAQTASVVTGVAINPSATATLFMVYGNENGGSGFTSFKLSATTTEHDTGVEEATGYKLAQASGSVTAGINGGSDNTVDVFLCVALLESSGATRPVKMAGTWNGYAGRSGGFAG